MHPGRVKISLSALVALVAYLAILPGCGGSAYESLLTRRLIQLRSGAPFKILFGPTQIPDTQVSLRVPMAFRKSYTPDSAHADDGGKIKPDRVNPPFLPLPGLKLCYEEMASDPTSGKLPFYCYLAVVPEGGAAAITSELQAKLKATFPNTPDEWENVDAETPDGKAVAWKRIRIEADQPFRVPNEPEPKMLPGIFELWIHGSEDEGNVVIVGWRAPKSIDGPIAIPTAEQNPLMQLTMDPKPDLTAMPIRTAGTLKIGAQPDGGG